MSQDIAIHDGFSLGDGKRLPPKPAIGFVLVGKPQLTRKYADRIFEVWHWGEGLKNFQAEVYHISTHNPENPEHPEKQIQYPEEQVRRDLHETVHLLNRVDYIKMVGVFTTNDFDVSHECQVVWPRKELTPHNWIRVRAPIPTLIAIKQFRVVRLVDFEVQLPLLTLLTIKHLRIIRSGQRVGMQ